MERATIRDLRYPFAAVETRLQEGEEIPITRRKRVIARLVPEPASRSPRLPAFAARLAKTYERKKLASRGAQLIRAERDERN